MPESCTQEAYKIEIVKRSNLLEISQPGDEVMADKGFLIKDELASVGAALVLPKFLQGKTNSTRKKLHKTYIHTYIHTYTLLSVPEKGFSASILKNIKIINK